MKKVSLFVFLISFVMISSCKKSALDPLNAGSCEKETAVYSKAIEAYASDFTNKSKCEAVKKSLNDLINKCAVLTPLLRKEYQEDLKDFKCD